METAEQQEEKAPRTLRIRISDLLDKAIAGIEERFAAKDFKPTMGDYLKLLQMEIELEQEEIKEIKVTWVEPPVTSDSGN
jgi:CYTH domain-containing protein